MFSSHLQGLTQTHIPMLSFNTQTTFLVVVGASWYFISRGHFPPQTMKMHTHPLPLYPLPHFMMQIRRQTRIPCVPSLCLGPGTTSVDFQREVKDCSKIIYGYTRLSSSWVLYTNRSPYYHVPRLLNTLCAEFAGVLDQLTHWDGPS